MQSPVAPQLTALTAADCEGLRKTVNSGAQELAVVTIMTHLHSKLLACTTAIDVISPFVNCWEVWLKEYRCMQLGS